MNHCNQVLEGGKKVVITNREDQRKLSSDRVGSKIQKLTDRCYRTPERFRNCRFEVLIKAQIQGELKRRGYVMAIQTPRRLGPLP